MNYRSPLTHELIMKFYYPRPIRFASQGKQSTPIRESDYDATRR